MTMHCTKSTPDSEMVGVCKSGAPGEETPTLQLSSAAQLPQNTNCLACSEDSMYLGLGHAGGLSVWCASSLSPVAEWLQDTLEITKMEMTRMAKDVYLLGTTDDMGVARVYAYHHETIHLLSVINTVENVNQRTVCLTFELSKGGVYGAASMRCNGDVWLEVYHFPSEAWLKELEKEESQKQDENSTGNADVKWSPVAVSKIKPPKPPKGPTLQDPYKRSKADFLAHCLSLDVETSSYQREGQSFRVESGKTKKINDRCCTHHFLLPCGLLPAKNTKKSSPAGLPVAICVWWSGNHNLLQYSLEKTSKIKPADAEPMPDMLWPNAKKILCSAVSNCTRYIAVGLEGAIVCVWDRMSGSPLLIVLVSAADSAFVKVQFVDHRPDSADDTSQYIAEKVHLLFFCKSGVIHIVTTGRGTQSHAAQLTERPADSRDLPTAIASVPFLHGLFLVVQRNGKIFLQDVINQNIVCSLTPPASHLITTPCNPIYALSIVKPTLFIQGELESSCSAPSEGGSQSQLFTFYFGESDVTKKYMVSLRDSPRQAVSCVNLEESCNLYLKQRLLSVDGMGKSVVDT
ncbi:WD repeat-containing protein 93 isoform X1 [Halichoeres trimaculatus]|uniref:WD repeat-containing protein 93 isoform X1 n=1 Tax=Halichoeres trimaculatus TaxID=147232 RepID=UPI003D9E818A